MAAGCGRHLESSTGIPLWTTDDNRFKLCSTDARQQQMANVTNVTDVTNAQEQVEVIVSIVWLSPLTWKTNERHTRSERVCDRLQCLQTEDEKANIILLDSIRVTLHYTWLGTSWHTTCTSLHISAFSRVKQGPSVFIILSPYQYHTSTRLKLFTIGKRMAAAKRSRMVASCRYALPGILIIDDHWWSLIIVLQTISRSLSHCSSEEEPKNRPQPCLIVSGSFGCHLETQGQSSFDRQPQFIFKGVINRYHVLYWIPSYDVWENIRTHHPMSPFPLQAKRETLKIKTCRGLFHIDPQQVNRSHLVQWQDKTR